MTLKAPRNNWSESARLLINRREVSQPFDPTQKPFSFGAGPGVPKGRRREQLRLLLPTSSPLVRYFLLRSMIHLLFPILFVKPTTSANGQFSIDHVFLALGAAAFLMLPSFLGCPF